MDNRIFNVNGRSKAQLLNTIQLALSQTSYNANPTIIGWVIDKSKGFILLDYMSDYTKGTKFPVPVTAETVLPIVWDWLKSEEAEKIPMEGWDANADHDGDNELGFRVYCEDWGHIGEYRNAIVAIKPAYCWYGK